MCAHKNLHRCLCRHVCRHLCSKHTGRSGARCQGLWVIFLSACPYTCHYKCRYICAYTHVYICRHRWLYTWIHTHLYACLHTVDTPVHMSVYTSICTGKHLYATSSLGTRPYSNLHSCLYMQVRTSMIYLRTGQCNRLYTYLCSVG